MKKILGVVLAVLLFLPVGSFAKGKGLGKNPEMKAKREEFRAQQKAKGQEFHQKQKQENQDFKKSLEGKTPEEKKAAMEAHRKTQQTENAAFQGQMKDTRKTFNAANHEERMAKLQEMLAGNKNLTDAQKAEMISFFENQYQENVTHSDANFASNQAFFAETMNNADLTPEQKKAAIKEYMEKQKAAGKEYIDKQKAESKGEMQKIKPVRPKGDKSASETSPL